MVHRLVKTFNVCLDIEYRVLQVKKMSSLFEFTSSEIL